MQPNTDRTRRGGHQGQESSGGDGPWSSEGPGTAACSRQPEWASAATGHSEAPEGHGLRVEPNLPRLAGLGLSVNT